MWWCTILPITGCVHFNLLSFLFCWKKVVCIIVLTEFKYSCFEICNLCLWEDLQFQETKKKFRMEGKTSPNFTWKGGLGEKQWLRSLSLADWMTELSWPQIFVLRPFLLGLPCVRRPWWQWGCLNEKVFEKGTPALWHWWLSTYVLHILLMWAHVVKKFSIYTHAQGFRCENEQGLDHSTEIHFDGSTIKLTLDLYSLWHNLSIFY